MNKSVKKPGIFSLLLAVIFLNPLAWFIVPLLAVITVIIIFFFISLLPYWIAFGIFISLAIYFFEKYFD